MIGIAPRQEVQQPEAQLGGITNAGNSPSQSNSKQSLTREVTEKECILLDLLDEFTKTDDGKVLASQLGKLARLAQSRAAKSSVTKELSEES